MHIYSPFFKTLHDETAPVGYLGRGTHYSVVRSVTFKDTFGTVHDKAIFHDMAIVWDEDHDTRVIEAILLLYYNGLLSPVLFIGERKGCLTLILDELVVERNGPKWFFEYEQAVKDISNSLEDDSWPATVSSFPNPAGIISDSEDRVMQYLSTIEMQWRLGCKLAEEYHGPTV